MEKCDSCIHSGTCGFHDDWVPECYNYGKEETSMDKLQKAIEERGIKKTKIAEALGISTVALYGKLDGKYQFKPSEIKALQELMRLSDAEVKEMFLS